MAEEIVRTFYVVTTVPDPYSASLYEVKCNPNNDVVATKIALRGRNAAEVGYQIGAGYGMMAISRHLIPYIPEGGGMSTLERDITKVNTRYWGNTSSPIVAAFLRKDPAEQCLDSVNLSPCDHRWRTETEETLRAIGKEHPQIEIPADPGLALIPGWNQ